MSALARFCEAENMSLADLSSLSDGMTPIRALKIVHIGLMDGYRREKTVCPFTLEDVGDIIDDDPDFLSKCMDIVSNSMPGAAGNGQAAKPKRASR